MCFARRRRHHCGGAGDVATPRRIARVAAPKTAAKPREERRESAAKCKVAPADEYFGKLKMSILGIRNTIKDQGIKIDYDPQKAAARRSARSR